MLFSLLLTSLSSSPSMRSRPHSSLLTGAVSLCSLLASARPSFKSYLIFVIVFTLTPEVVSATNIRYASSLVSSWRKKNQCVSASNMNVLVLVRSLMSGTEEEHLLGKLPQTFIHLVDFQRVCYVKSLLASASFN